MNRACVYCLENGRVGPEQVLLSGEHLYLCVPLGQIIEGFLIIAPHRCVSTFAACPVETLAELKALGDTVKAFYGECFDSHGWTFYEQGRGGGGAVVDRAGGFPLHAHLCALPRDVDLHRDLKEQLPSYRLDDVLELGPIVGDRPYLYVETREESRAYVGSTPEQRLAVEISRLRPSVARLLGCPERGDWRACRDDDERAELTEKWRRYVGR